MLILLRGLQGSGKTTFAKLLVAMSGEPMVHHEADQYFLDEAGEYQFCKSYLPTANDLCFEATKAALEVGQHVVVSNVFAQLWTLDRYLALAEELDVPAFVLLVEGDFGSDKNIPLSSILHTKRHWQPYASDWSV